MKHALLAISLAAMLTGVAAHTPAFADSGIELASATTTPKLTKWQQHQKEMEAVSAPGDEYFGSQKMSFLGINNVLRDQTRRAGAHSINPSITHQLDLADESLRAWERKYPHDPDLARSYFLAVQAYQKIWTRPYQEKAWQYMHIIVQRYPSTYFGKVVKKNLAVGFTEHYYAEPKPCPLPTAAPEAPTEQPQRGHTDAQPTPTDEATQQPTEQPTATATATPKPKPGQPKVDIIEPPCVPPMSATR